MNNRDLRSLDERLSLVRTGGRGRCRSSSTEVSFRRSKYEEQLGSMKQTVKALILYAEGVERYNGRGEGQ